MVQDIIAIDSHTHINHNVRFDSEPGSLLWDFSLEWLRQMNLAANIDKMLCSTFSSVLAVEDVEEENEYMHELAKANSFLFQWVVIDPRNDNTFRQAEKMLGTKKCVGVKLHPVCHKYTLEEYGDKIFSFLSGSKTIIQIHPETDASYILPFSDKYDDLTFIMAHMGAYGQTSYADAIEHSRHGNVYIDTSSSASFRNKTLEYVVDRVGSERILFGTDAYAAGFQRGRIEYALISPQDKYNILRGNAEKLFAKWF